MTVRHLPTPDRDPGLPPEWEAMRLQPMPPGLVALLPPNSPEGASDCVQLGLPHLCRQGLPEAVLEAALGWPAGTLAGWRRLPHAVGWLGPRHLADACAAASAEAEAELVAALHRRGRTDPKAAQWLLERRRPERWGAATADVASAVSRIVVAVHAALPDVDPEALRAALERAADGGGR